MSCKKEAVNPYWDKSAKKTNKVFEEYAKFRDEDETNTSHLSEKNGTMRQFIKTEMASQLMFAGMDKDEAKGLTSVMTEIDVDTGKPKVDAEVDAEVRVDRISEALVNLPMLMSENSEYTKEFITPEFQGKLANVMGSMQNILSDKFINSINSDDIGAGGKHVGLETFKKSLNDIFNSGTVGKTVKANTLTELDAKTRKVWEAEFKKTIKDNPHTSKLKGKDLTDTVNKRIESRLKSNEIRQGFWKYNLENDPDGLFKKAFDLSLDSGMRFEAKDKSFFDQSFAEDILKLTTAKLSEGLNKQPKEFMNTITALDALFTAYTHREDVKGNSLGMSDVISKAMDMRDTKIANIKESFALSMDEDGIPLMNAMRDAVMEKVEVKFQKTLANGQLGTKLSHTPFKGTGAIGKTFAKQPFMFNMEFFNNKNRKGQVDYKKLQGKLDGYLSAMIRSGKSDRITGIKPAHERFTAINGKQIRRSSRLIKAENELREHIDMMRNKGILDIGDKLQTKDYAHALVETYSLADKPIYINMDVDPRGSRLKAPGTSHLTGGMHALLIPAKPEKPIEPKNPIYAIDEAEMARWLDEDGHKERDWQAAGMMELDQTTSGITLTQGFLGNKHDMARLTKLNGGSVDAYEFAGTQLLNVAIDPSDMKREAEAVTSGRSAGLTKARTAYNKKSDKLKAKQSKALRKMVKGANGNATIYGIGITTMMNHLDNFIKENPIVVKDAGLKQIIDLEGNARTEALRNISNKIIDTLNPTYQFGEGTLTTVGILERIHSIIPVINMGGAVKSEPKSKLKSLDLFGNTLYSVSGRKAGTAASFAHGLDATIMNEVARRLQKEGIEIQPRHDAIVAHYEVMGRIREVELEVIAEKTKSVRNLVMELLEKDDPEFLEQLIENGFFEVDVDAETSIGVFSH